MDNIYLNYIYFSRCTECSKCFTYKHHLNRHMMIVHNADSLEKPFKCSVCDKAFSFKEYLTLHVKYVYRLSILHQNNI